MSVDPSGLGPKGMMALRQRLTPEEHDKKLKEVAEMYEKQFLQTMVRAMRGTVPESGFIKVNQAEKIFRDELDAEHVGNWAKQGGMGLGQMIYQQLIDKYGGALGLKTPLEKPKGPIQLGENTVIHGKILPSSGSSTKTTVQFSRFEESDRLSLQSPWEGVLLGSRNLGAEENLLEIQHSNGLKSQLVFRGQPLAGLHGKNIQSGETIGLLSPEAKTFFWNIESGQKTTVDIVE